MKTIILSLILASVTAQAGQSTCASRGAGTLIPKTDYSHLLEEKRAAPARSNQQMQQSQRAQGADGFTKKK